MMNRRMIHLTLAAVLVVAVTGCSRQHGTYGKNMSGEMDVTTPTGTQNRPVIVQSQPVIVQSQPVIVQSQPAGLQGQVIRNEGNALVIQEASGRQTRVLLDRATTVDNNIAVGDNVVVRYGGPPTSPYPASITRTVVVPSTSTAIVVPSTSPTGFRVVEGVVVQQTGSYYVIREDSGREVRLHADTTTRFDRDIRPGDRVVVTVREQAADTLYASNVVRLERPQISSVRGGATTLTGQVVGTDGNRYTIRDSGGRDITLDVDNTTLLNRDIRVGDSVLAVNARPASTPYDRDIYSLYKSAGGNTIQGELIRTDGDVYIVRDLSGRDVHLMTDARTVRNENIRVGDVIVVYTGPPSTIHADSIEHR